MIGLWTPVPPLPMLLLLLSDTLRLSSALEAETEGKDGDRDGDGDIAEAKAQVGAGGNGARSHCVCARETTRHAYLSSALYCTTSTRLFKSRAREQSLLLPCSLVSSAVLYTEMYTV